MRLFIPSVATIAACVAVHIGLPLPPGPELAVLGLVGLAQLVQAIYYERELAREKAEREAILRAARAARLHRLELPAQVNQAAD